MTSWRSEKRGETLEIHDVMEKREHDEHEVRRGDMVVPELG